jgi:hypothetical protein
VKLPVSITLVLTLIYFAVGWLGYDWVVEQVTTGVGVPVLVDSVQKAFEHRAISSLSFVLIGLSIGLGAWMSVGDLKKYYIKFVIGFFFVSVLVSAVWLQYLTRRLATLPGDLEAATGVPITALTVSDVTIYEIGLFVSGILWIIVVSVVTLNSLGFGIKSKFTMK